MIFESSKHKVESSPYSQWKWNLSYYSVPSDNLRRRISVCLLRTIHMWIACITCLGIDDVVCWSPVITSRLHYFVVATLKMSPAGASRYTRTEWWTSLRHSVDSAHQSSYTRQFFHSQVDAFRVKAIRLLFILEEGVYHLINGCSRKGRIMLVAQNQQLVFEWKVAWFIG